RGGARCTDAQCAGGGRVARPSASAPACSAASRSRAPVGQLAQGATAPGQDLSAPPAAARGCRRQAGERARLVSRPDGPGRPADPQPRQEPPAGQGQLGCELGPLPARGGVLWAGAAGAGAGGAAPLHEPSVLGLWQAGAQILGGADPCLSALWAGPGPGPARPPRQPPSDAAPTRPP